MQQDGRRRAVIEAVTPQVDGGRFAVMPGTLSSFPTATPE